MNFLLSRYNVDTNYVANLLQNYSIDAVAEILSSEYSKNFNYIYLSGDLYAYYLQSKAMDPYLLYTEHGHLFNTKVREFILAHFNTLNNTIDHNRDYGFQYLSVKDIDTSYLYKIDGKSVESIQWMWMRVAVQVAYDDKWKELPEPERLKEVIDTYDMLSLKYAIHATPTCVNAGHKNSQMESCFCVDMGDSMDAIAFAKTTILMGSKANGGFGLYCGRIRHSRVANRGITKGVPGVLQTFNTDIVYADQLGSRPGAVTAQLPIWHTDIETFIIMKNPNVCPKAILCENLHYTVCIPDLFYKRLNEKGKWSLFCPRKTQVLYAKLKGLDYKISEVVDKCPSLCDFWGQEFEEFYLQCEKAGIADKVIDAESLEAEIEKNRCQVGEPFRMELDNVNRKSNHSHLGPVVMSNLCVRGDTKILTDHGYVPIIECVDKETTIWNGEEWSTVTPRKTGTNQHLLTVKFSNGSEVHMTPYHKVYTTKGNRSKEMVKDAKDLQVGDKIIKCEYPIVTKYDEERDKYMGKYAYTHGFFCGDGTYVRDKPYIRLYGQKEELVNYIDVKSKPVLEDGLQRRIRCRLPDDLPAKFTVPHNCSVPTKIKWLEGYLDADGTVVYNSGYYSIQVSSIEKKFLDSIKLLLQTLGCNSKYSQNNIERKQMFPKNDGTGDYKEYNCNPTWRLCISTKDLIALKKLGFSPKRLKFNVPESMKQKDTSIYITVESVIDENEYADTYCFTEPKAHKGIFGGVILGNCTEITQYTKPNEITPTCDLATVNLPSFVIKNSDSNSVHKYTIDWKKMGTVARQLTRNLDRVIDRTSGILPNEGQLYCESMLSHEDPKVREMASTFLQWVRKDPTHTARQRNRAFGIGVMGFASMCALLGIEYGSKEAYDLGATIRACIYYHSIDESANIAQGIDISDINYTIYTSNGKGPYPTFEGSHYSKGILHPDLVEQEDVYMKKVLLELQSKGDMFKDMKRFTSKIIDPTEFGVSSTWENLRLKVKKGVRNSLTTCQMPNVTTSNVFGVTPGMEPSYGVLFSIKKVNGTHVTTYDAFKDILIRENLYDPIKLPQFLESSKGNIVGLHTIYDTPENINKAKKIESLFPISFSINKKKYIIGITKWCKYIDQAYSLNMFYDKPNSKYTTELSRLYWINGGKLQYYLRRLASTSQISKEFGKAAEDTSNNYNNVSSDTKDTIVQQVCSRTDSECRFCQ